MHVHFYDRIRTIRRNDRIHLRKIERKDSENNFVSEYILYKRLVHFFVSACRNL